MPEIASAADAPSIAGCRSRSRGSSDTTVRHHLDFIAGKPSGTAGESGGRSAGGERLLLRGTTLALEEASLDAAAAYVFST